MASGRSPPVGARGRLLLRDAGLRGARDHDIRDGPLRPVARPRPRLRGGRDPGPHRLLRGRGVRGGDDFGPPRLERAAGRARVRRRLRRPRGTRLGMGAPSLPRARLPHADPRDRDPPPGAREHARGLDGGVRRADRHHHRPNLRPSSRTTSGATTYYWYSLTILFVCFLVFRRLVHSPFGRSLTGDPREHEADARRSARRSIGGWSSPTRSRRAWRASRGRSSRSRTSS